MNNRERPDQAVNATSNIVPHDAVCRVVIRGGSSSDVHHASQVSYTAEVHDLRHFRSDEYAQPTGTAPHFYSEIFLFLYRLNPNKQQMPCNRVERPTTPPLPLASPSRLHPHDEEMAHYKVERQYSPASPPTSP